MACWRANAWVKAGILLGFRLVWVGPAATAETFELIMEH